MFLLRSSRDPLPEKVRVGIAVSNCTLRWVLVLWLLFSVDLESVLVEVLVQLISRL